MTENVGDGSGQEPTGIIDMLEAAKEGGLRLDTIIAYAVAGADLVTGTLREVVMEGAFSVEVANELLDGRPPPFTRTLDSVIPGENIVLTAYSDRRARWAAVQRGADGAEFVAWAATEALARRAAALRGMRETTPSRTVEPVAIARKDTAPERQPPRAVEVPAAESDNASDWQIRF